MVWLLLQLQLSLLMLVVLGLCGIGAAGAVRGRNPGPFLWQVQGRRLQQRLWLPVQHLCERQPLGVVVVVVLPAEAHWVYMHAARLAVDAGWQQQRQLWAVLQCWGKGGRAEGVWRAAMGRCGAVAAG